MYYDNYDELDDLRLGFNNVTKNWAFITQYSDIIYYRKGIEVLRGKIVDFFVDDNGKNVKCKFNNGVELNFPFSKLRRSETFWWIVID